uniref:Uncharacterized protein n=1 Tax=Janibacter limosus TaxID=53458 RepID=A0AC61U158_9MICO|nr:hypothetical protein [Janibacter limosus]
MSPTPSARSPWGTVLGPLVIGQLSALVIFAITLAIPGKGAGTRAPLAALGCTIGGGVSLMCLSGCRRRRRGPEPPGPVGLPRRHPRRDGVAGGRLGPDKSS